MIGTANWITFLSIEQNCIVCKKLLLQGLSFNIEKSFLYVTWAKEIFTADTLLFFSSGEVQLKEANARNYFFKHRSNLPLFSPALFMHSTTGMKLAANPFLII